MQSTGNTVRVGAIKDPTTKANFLDKIMQRDFTGDLADLAVNRDLRIARVKANSITLTFGDSGQQFELTVRKPRTEEWKAAMRKKLALKQGGGKKSAAKTGHLRTVDGDAHSPEARQPTRVAAAATKRPATRTPRMEEQPDI